MNEPFNDDDVASKRDGFGIGELGGVPETTPHDELVARYLERRAATPQAESPRYRIVYWNVGDVELYPDEAEDMRRDFGDLESLLVFARTLGYWPQQSASLFGPGYTIGTLRDNCLTWRVPIHLKAPRATCDECGGDADGGRCSVCGETDMLQTSWSTWDNHVEHLRGNNVRS